MTDDELARALRVHYDDRLPADRQAALVAGATPRRGVWMPVLIGMVAMAVLWLAVSARTPTPAAQAPAVAPTVETKLQASIWLLSLSDAERSRLDVDMTDMPVDPVVLLPAWPDVTATGTLVANPTVMMLSGEEALVAWSGPTERTTSVLLTVTEKEPGWHADVAVTLPTQAEPFTWAGTYSSETLGLAFLLDTPDASWVVVLDTGRADRPVQP